MSVKPAAAGLARRPDPCKWIGLFPDVSPVGSGCLLESDGGPATRFQLHTDGARRAHLGSSYDADPSHHGVGIDFTGVGPKAAAQAVVGADWALVGHAIRV
ncbi:MAG: hypothetical protein WBU92_04175 [Candidatus Dormiibacterota bacterium]